MITIEVGNVASRIKGTLDYQASNALSEACSYEVKGAEYMNQKRSPYARSRFGNWDGKKRLFHKQYKTFPTGLLHRVTGILESLGHTINITYDPIEVQNAQLPSKGLEKWALRPYQTKAVRDAIAARRCMVKVATGGGKTVMAGHIIYQVCKPAIFFVHTKDLLYQAYDTFASMFGSLNVGVIGDGKQEIGRPITVATIQSVARALDIKYQKDKYAEDDWLDNTTLGSDATSWLHEMAQESCGLVIMDECHRVAAPTATDVLAAFTAADYRIGMSASPWRDDGADLALEGVFGHVAVDINASWLIDNGWLVEPIIKIVPAEPMSFPKGTKYATIYEQYIVDNDERNELVVENTVRLVKQGRPTMVLVSRINHGTALAQELTERLGYVVPFLSGKDDSDVRREVLDGMRDGEYKCFVATTIADEGLDIKPLSGLVLAGAGKSSTRALQRVGRSLRPFANKKNAVVIDFEDNAKYLLQHTQERMKIYESEERFIILD